MQDGLPYGRLAGSVRLLGSLLGHSRHVAGPSFRGHVLSGVFGAYFPGAQVDWLLAPLAAVLCGRV